MFTRLVHIREAPAFISYLASFMFDLSFFIRGGCPGHFTSKFRVEEDHPFIHDFEVLCHHLELLVELTYQRVYLVRLYLYHIAVAPGLVL